MLKLPTTVKLVVFGVLVGVATFVLCAVAFYVWFFWGYYDELDLVRARLEELPGVKVVKTGGNEDVTLEDIWAEIDVQGEGEMLLVGVTSASFESTATPSFGRVGPFFPRVTGFGYGATYCTSSGKPTKSLYFSDAANFGPTREFASQLSTPVQNVGDAVARFAEVRSALSAWPRCPDFAELTHKDGTEIRYCVSDSPGGDTPDPSPSWTSGLTNRCS